MPYIKLEDRGRLDKRPWDAATPGELNYVLTNAVLVYLDNTGKSYQTINDIVGALECAKQEFYRRVAVPYEEQKRFELGDVYDNT